MNNPTKFNLRNEDCENFPIPSPFFPLSHSIIKSHHHPRNEDCGKWERGSFPFSQLLIPTPTKSSAPQFGRALPYCSPTTEALPRRSKITNNLSLPRSLLQKRTCSCTPRCTCASPSRTSAASAASHSPTAPTCRSTCGSTSGSSRTVARSANASSPSSPTFSSTSGRTQGTSLTSAGFQVS